MKYIWLILTLFISMACHSNDPDKNTPEHNEKSQTESENICLSSSSGFTDAFASGDYSQLERCLTFFPKNAETIGFLYPARVYIDLTQANQNEQYEFANWADNHQDLLQNLNGWPSASAFGEVYSVDHELKRATLEALLDPFLMPTRPVDFILRPPAPKVFFNVKDLLQFLENPNRKNAVNPEDFRDPRAQALVAYYEGADFKRGLKVSEFLSASGCLQSCLEASEKLAFGHYFIQYRQFSVNGLVFRQEILLMDSDNSIVAYASLAQDRLLALALIERDVYGKMTKITALSPQGKTVGDYSYGNRSEEALAERNRLSPGTNSFASVVGICEEEISPRMMSSLNADKALVLGPNLSESYYGWQKEKSTPAQFWSGRFYLNRLNLPFTTETFADHARKTIATFIGNEDPMAIGIVPLGIDQCLKADQAGGWTSTAEAESKLRVINISASEASDEEGCRSMMKDHPIHDSRFLWVIAAGNQGSPKPVACPQFLAGQSNVLIVGASRNSRMHEKSNFGKNNVDIATSGNSFDDNDWGTSFAAPRVSRVAAKVFEKIPQATPAQVRALILASAKIPQRPLPVRSAGELDEAAALEIAEHIKDGLSLQKAIEKEFCGWNEDHCKERKLLIKNLGKGEK